MNNIVLFCLPYAGGSESIYANWKKYLDPSIELHAIKLSGRGKRFNESLYSSLDKAIEDIYSQIKPYLHKPFIFFGHSMGSLLAYELAYKVKQLNGVNPFHMFLSGGKTPQGYANENKKIHLFPNEEFKNEIKQMGGTPQEILDNPELLDIFIPILKSDFKIIENYIFSSDNFKFDCNITVLHGRKDDISEEEILRWKLYTKKNCNIVPFEGGHFFINECTESIVKLINQEIQNKFLYNYNFI
ncbi:thioesterase [Bacillus thuringiensis]|uniref:thioesterase II family protein n=1 Tax=Bacillus cereus group TaxID=86661 RepID=UPI000BF31992|nr:MULTISPECIES: thioesterase domain-containing protein [Bacillus cereus group]MBE5096681.1 thioesterase [Bacillus thuringiensis]PFN81839.1 thioesterase [Bacillus thuringiensis]PGX91495.1 thioesterase [Bacillus thuringiensis]QDD86870.1 Thioesterase [Bacillus cereus]